MLAIICRASLTVVSKVIVSIIFASLKCRLIMLPKIILKNQSVDFQPFDLSLDDKKGAAYWLATENNTSGSAWSIKFYPMAVKYTSSLISKGSTLYLRCIRDIPLK